MSKDLPLPKGYEYVAPLFPLVSPLRGSAEGRHEALLHSAPSIHIELTPDPGCCYLCCEHDEPHFLPGGPEHEDC